MFSGTETGESETPDNGGKLYPIRMIELEVCTEELHLCWTGEAVLTPWGQGRGLDQGSVNGGFIKNYSFIAFKKNC